MIAPPLSHLHREDTAKARGWKLVVQRDRKVYCKFFGDSRWGGREAALAAACVQRHKLLGQLPPPVHPLYFESNSLNTSGVIGVGRSRERSRRGVWYAYYKARWKTPEGQLKQKKFSVEKYGESEAFQLAVEAREQGLQELKKRSPVRLIPGLDRLDAIIPTHRSRLVQFARRS